MTVLERRYRRLLVAYPGRYDRTEMLTTLMEMAEPGQTRPHRADAWHLATTGLRHRFRLPAGRPLPWAAAVLITLILGGFGAAAGSWLAEQTFTAVPDDTAFAALITTAAGGSGDVSSVRGNSPWWGEGLHGYSERTGWTADQGRRALTAAGWQLEPSQVQHETSQAVTTNLTRFAGHRDGLTVDVFGAEYSSGASVSVDAWADDTGALLPLIAAGGLAGLLLGWPLTAAAAYRVRRLTAARARTATTLTGLAVVVLALPAVAFYGNIIRAGKAAGQPWMPMTVHSALNPGPYYPFGPSWLVLGLTVAGLVLALGAVGVLLPRPAPVPVLMGA